MFIRGLRIRVGSRVGGNEGGEDAMDEEGGDGEDQGTGLGAGDLIDRLAFSAASMALRRS